MCLASTSGPFFCWKKCTALCRCSGFSPCHFLLVKVMCKCVPWLFPFFLCSFWVVVWAMRIVKSCMLIDVDPREMLRSHTQGQTISCSMIMIMFKFGYIQVPQNRDFLQCHIGCYIDPWYPHPPLMMVVPKCSRQTHFIFYMQVLYSIHAHIYIYIYSIGSQFQIPTFVA